MCQCWLKQDKRLSLSLCWLPCDICRFVVVILQNEFRVLRSWTFVLSASPLMSPRNGTHEQIRQTVWSFLLTSACKSIDFFSCSFIFIFFSLNFNIIQFAHKLKASSSIENIFSSLMRNVFLNYWHCARLQVENFRNEEQFLKNTHPYSQIKLQHINFSFGNFLLLETNTKSELSRCNWIIFIHSFPSSFCHRHNKFRFSREFSRCRYCGMSFLLQFFQ